MTVANSEASFGPLTILPSARWSGSAVRQKRRLSLMCRCLTSPRKAAGGPPQGGFFGGWLGRSYDPLFILKDPNQPDFGMPELSPPPNVGQGRLERRQRLVAGLGGPPDGLRHDRRLQDLDRFQARAFDLLTSSSVRVAMRIDREDPRTRDRYGRNIYGQSVLLARRLIEAGVRVASISWALTPTRPGTRTPITSQP